MRFLLFLVLGLCPLMSMASSSNLVEELMLDAKAIQFDGQGKIAQQLEIQKIFHKKGESITHFIKPNLILNQADGSSWKITSNSGKSIHTKNGNKFSNLEFCNEVKIMQFALNSKQAIWSLFTDFMVVHPKMKTIHTLAPIKIDNKNLIISANGLSGDLKTQKMVLLKDVRTQFKEDKL